MSTLYDPRVSAACLALREDPPAALDGPILQYARDALHAAEALREANPSLWRRRTFAAIVAFIGVVSFAAWWERSQAPRPAESAVSAPVIEYVAPVAPLVIEPPAAARLEVKPPVVKPKPKRKAEAPPTRATTATPSATGSAAIPDEPVQVKTIAVDEDLAPTPLAPPAPAPALESTSPSAEACAADPLTEGCAPSL